MPQIERNNAAYAGQATGLTEPELVAACRDGWALDAAGVEYLPVGAGSYHWSVADRHGDGADAAAALTYLTGHLEAR